MSKHMSGFRIKAGNNFRSIKDILQSYSESLRNLFITSCLQIFEVVAQNLVYHPSLHPELLNLYKQALSKVSCCDSGRIEILDPFENPFYSLVRRFIGSGNIFYRGSQITIFVNIPDDLDSYNDIFLFKF